MLSVDDRKLLLEQLKEYRTTVDGVPPKPYQNVYAEGYTDTQLIAVHAKWRDWARSGVVK